MLLYNGGNYKNKHIGVHLWYKTKIGISKENGKWPKNSIYLENVEEE